MTTTYEWLETYNGVGAGLSLAIEGTPTTFGTDSMTGVYTSAASPYSAFADPIGGLMVRGKISSRIQLYAQDIEAGTMSFTVVDKAGALIGTVLREAYSSGHRTYLTSSVTAGATATINVKDTTGFAASGTIYIGDEAIAYTGKTASTFTGITRAQYVINQTNGGAAFAPAHNIGNNVTTSATTAPSVTDYPRTWYGRFVHMFLHYRDPLTGTYNVASAATKLWSGRIESYRDNGDGTITITAKSALDLVNRAVGSEPWTAVLEEGVAFDSNTDTILAGNSHAPAYNPAASLALSGRKSHDDVATAIQAQFDTWNSGGNTRAGDMWEIKLLDIPDGGPPRYQFTLFANTTTPAAGSTIGIGLHPNMWRLLGWEDSAGIPVIASNGNPINIRLLQPRTTTRWELRAPLPPIVYYRHNLITNEVAYVSKQVGTFATTTSSDLGMPGPDTAINGVIQIKESSHFDGDIFSVIYTAGSPTATLKIAGKLDTTDGKFKTTYGPGASSAGDPQNGIVRLGDASRAPIVKQVYYQHGNAGDVLLRAMLSTGGASGYNHADYDTGPTSTFGAALPASLVDVSSFEELNDVSLGFVVTDAKPLLEHLEPILAVTNRYVVWKAADATSNPKLTIVRPHLDNTTLTSWQLTESTKAAGASAGRIAVERGAEGIVNRVVVKYGQGWAKTGDARTWIVEDIASQSDYGRRRTVTIDAPTVTNVEVVAPKTIGTALAYFARPLALAETTFNASLIRMSPGDSVSVTDNYLVDPATGARGAFLYGWVLDTEFDLETGQGRVRIVFLPERPPRAYRFAPSARVDETAGGGGYNAGTRTLTTVQNEFSLSGAAGDALSFVAGDKVHIYALDESAPLEWFDTVLSSTATSVRLLIGLAGFDTAKRYVIEYDDIATVQSSQKTSAAYIADDATLSTGGSPSTPYEWGGDELYPVSNTLRTYDVGLGMPNSTYATAGEPMSVHKVHYLVKGLNALLAYKTRSTHINQYLSTAITVTGTTPKLLFCGWVPVYGHKNFGTRSFVARLFIKQTGGGTATFTVRSSGNKPFGTSFTSYSFKNTAASVSTNTTSSTLVWSSELSLGCQVGAEFGQLAGTFITVEGVGSGGGITATLQGIFVGEAAL